MRDKTLLSYQNIIKRYPNLNISNARESYMTLREFGHSLGYIKNVMCAFKWNTNIPEYGIIIKELCSEIAISREKHYNKFKKLKWEQIIPPSGHSLDDLIKGLYTFFPPRRISDYAYMIYHTVEPLHLNPNYNYYILDSNIFIFQNYKTVVKFGIQRFVVPDNLYKLIQNYVSATCINNGEPLLKFRKGSNIFSEQSLMKRIMKIFGTSIDGLRHSFISYIYHNKNQLLLMDEISKKMAHNIETHLQYLDKNNLE